jgi:hypothetical protein
VRELSQTSDWVKDLFSGFANLDYPAFRSMKAENLHITDVEQTINCHEVLESVAERLALLAGRLIIKQISKANRVQSLTDP